MDVLQCHPSVCSSRGREVVVTKQHTESRKFVVRVWWGGGWIV